MNYWLANKKYPDAIDFVKIHFISTLKVLEMAPSLPYVGTDNLEVMAAAHNYNSYLNRLINNHAPISGRVMDFGAGTGTHTKAIANSTRKMICVEPDPQLRNILSDAGYEAYSSLQDIEDHCCDFIFSLNVLEHIEDEASAANELNRVLKPGGLCLIYVPAFQILFSSMDKKVQHFRRYNKKMLNELMSSSGFVIEKSQYADSLGFFATLVFKIFGNKDGSVNKNGLILYDRFVFPLSRLIDKITHPFFGKNVFTLVRKP